LQMRRQLAQIDFSAVAGPAAASRAAHADLSEKLVFQRLTKAKLVYEAQRATVDPEDPVQGDLRVAMTAVMKQARAAMDQALGNVSGLAPSVADEEQRFYDLNLATWIAATPFRSAALAGRATPTIAEAQAASRYENTFDAYLKDVTARLLKLNVIGSEGRDIRKGLENALVTVTAPTGGGAPTVGPMTNAALVATAQGLIAQFKAIQDSADEATRMLDAIAPTVRTFAADTAKAAGTPVATALQKYFGVSDAGYSALIAARLERVSKELKGQGSLAVRTRQPTDPACTGTTQSIVEAHAEPNTVFFCSQPTAHSKSIALQLIHESVHAVIPKLGAKGVVRFKGQSPGDRAYPWERIFVRLGTEEALDNAASYEWFVGELQVGPPKQQPPSDTIANCTNADPVRDALARASFAARLATQWTAVDAASGAGPLPKEALPEVQKFFPTADNAKARPILRAYNDLLDLIKNDADVRCLKAGPPEVVGFAGGRAVTSSGLKGKGGKGGLTIELTPAWFALGDADKVQTMLTLLILKVNVSAVQPTDAFAQAQLALDVLTQAMPKPTTTLAQHQAADAAIP